MRKLTYTIIILIMGTWALRAQDYVVTIQGDSIPCKITKIDSKNIHFEADYKGRNKSFHLPLTEVESHHASYQQNPLEKIKAKKDFQRLRVALNTGIGWAASDALYNDYYSDDYDTWGGANWDGEINVFFNRFIGVGLKYSRFNSTEDQYAYDQCGDGDYYYTEGANENLTYFAPTFSARFVRSNSGNGLYTNISFGYLRWNYKKDYYGDDYQETVGFNFGLSYDIHLSENIGLGVQCSILYGVFGDIYENDWYYDDMYYGYDSYYSDDAAISQINLSVGIRFYN